MLDEVLIEVRSGNESDDSLYIFGHNFLIICPIFTFFSNFSERLALSVEGVGVCKLSEMVR